MEAKLNDLKTEASEVGLKINGKKTKEMRYNNRNKALLFLGNQEIEQVKQFCYQMCIRDRCARFHNMRS